jgi:hypothetical protein
MTHNGSDYGDDIMVIVTANLIYLFSVLRFYTQI